MEKPKYTAEREPQDWIEREVISLIESLCQSATNIEDLTIPLDERIEEMISKHDSPMAWYHDDETGEIMLVGIENEEIGRIEMPKSWK